MTTYEIERPDGPERGIRVRCPEHGEEEALQLGHQRVAFYCAGCGFEVEDHLHDTQDWRDWGEMC